MEVPERCLLCGDVNEMIAHLFVNCSYVKKIWDSFRTRTNDAFTSMLTHGNQIWGSNVRVGDLIDGIEKFHRKVACWGLHWVGFGAFV